MAEKRKANPKFTSPKGIFIYPKLAEADYKFKKEGEFSVKVKMSAEAAKPLIDALQPMYEAALEEGQIKFDALPVASRKKFGKLTPNPFFTEVYDEETEEPTGEVMFKFSNTHLKESKKTGKSWKFAPKVFDAKGKIMNPVPSMWTGTEGKVNFEVFPYFNASSGSAGLSTRLLAAQIISIVEGGEASASSFGFGEEDGYEYSAPADTGQAAKDDGDDDGSEDF